MNALHSYMEERGRTADEVAVDLTALLGKQISPAGVRLWSKKAKPPKAWVDALGLEEPQPYLEEEVFFEDSGAVIEDDPRGTRDTATPPSPPDGAKVVRPTPGRAPLVTAKQRISMAYGAVGTGMSLITQNDGYEKVAESYAPELANAWIAAAETNERVAKIVRFMESGGPVGELVVSHVILVLGLVYVSGRGPQLDFLYGSRFGGYRTAAIAEGIRKEAEAHLNGSGEAAAASPLVGDQG